MTPPASAATGPRATTTTTDEAPERQSTPPRAKTPLDEVLSYMSKLRPKDDGQRGDDGVSAWARSQMSESPALLPDLRFHDLVFGRELGAGAFGTVRYARRIVRSLTRSGWPEYAVKVVSTTRIEEMGYGASVEREIAVLRTLSHPGVARLVSSFRFRDGAYLVLEYASGGDLHALLKRNGSVDEDSARFVVGSVAAALCSVHEMGYVYGDCKPEVSERGRCLSCMLYSGLHALTYISSLTPLTNDDFYLQNILITETGHIKVTDFGGCRPVTDEAKALVRRSGRNALRQLRDGDWKANARDENADASDKRDGSTTSDGSEEEEEEDTRIEGTTAYLPPEVVMGARPTFAADVWALGCVLFQCMSGRPPMLEETDDLTAERIVTFDSTADPGFFGDHGRSTFGDAARSLISRMLSHDPAGRPNMRLVASDPFFGGTDVFSLHRGRAHPLDVGSVDPSRVDARWSRRQFSSIWAPQPRAYDVGGGAASRGVGRSSGAGGEPIEEGDEADEEFLPRQKSTPLAKITE